MIDIQEKKNKILSILESGGPSIPVRISKAIAMDPVFASALLAELLSTKTIKMSNMKIGASPLYLIPGQEKRLEEHIEHLKSAEKDAYLKLKEKKLMADSEEEPATRVALRNLKDFAAPFKFKDKIMWRYTFAPQEEIQKMLEPQKEKGERESEKKIGEATKDDNHKEREAPPRPKSVVAQLKISARSANSREPEERQESPKQIEPIFKENKKGEPETVKQTFLEEIESFLGKQESEIVTMEEVDKKKVIAKIKTKDQEAILFAFNKKRIDEQELVKCYRKAKADNLPYQIIIRGSLTKKMNETINACKKLLEVDSLN